MKPTKSPGETSARGYQYQNIIWSSVRISSYHSFCSRSTSHIASKLACLSIALLLVGCTTTHVEKKKNGYVVDRKSFATKQIIRDLRIEESTNGIIVHMQGYANDQIEAIGVAVDAAVKAAITGLKGGL